MNWKEIIRIIKREARLKSITLAELTGVNQPYISRLESGDSKNPKSEFIQALIFKVHVNPYWLFGGTGPVIKVPDESDIGMPKLQAQQALDNLEQANTAAIAVLRQYLKSQ